MIVKKHLIWFLKLLGIILILFSILANIKVLGKFVAEDGVINNLVIISYFWIVRIIILILGIILLLNKFYINKINNHKRELILLNLSLVMCLLFAELISYNVVKNNYTHLAFKNQNLEYSNLEYNMSAKFNRFGFRDDEFNISKNYRIAIVGDSFVFGVGVNKNETFEYLIEEKLSNKYKKNVAIYNLGFSGGYPEDYMYIMKEMLPLLKPHITIVAIFLGNDVTCENKSLFNRLFLPNLRKIIINRIDYYGMLKASNSINDINISQTYKDYYKNNLINYNVIIRAVNQPNILEEYEHYIQSFNTCNYLKEYLIHMNKFSKKYNSTTLFIFIPPHYQLPKINSTPLKQIGYVFDEKLFVDQKLQNSIMKFCAENNLTCIDLLPYLKNSEKFPYYDLDGHFNKIGNNITAKVILTHLNNE